MNIKHTKLKIPTAYKNKPRIICSSYEWINALSFHEAMMRDFNSDKLYEGEYLVVDKRNLLQRWFERWLMNNDV